MAIKLVDTAVPMNEGGYPVVWAKNIWFDDYESLQNKLDNNELGSGGGSTVKLADVSGASVTTYMTTASITWTDPDNAVVDGVVMQDWAGTLVVRKEGSSPRNKDDGTVVVDNYTKNLYSSTPFEDTGLEYGKTYYYRFFPYSSNDVYTNGTSISVVPERLKIAVVPTLRGSYIYNGSLQTALFDNFDENQLDVSGNTATNAGNYTVTFTPKSDYCWINGSMETKDVLWTIAKADGNIVLSSTEVILDNDNISATIAMSDNTGVVTVLNSNDELVEVSISGNTITLTSKNREYDSATITVNVEESDNYNATTKNITVLSKFGVPIVTWADGTYDEISAMLDAHYAGTINISDYWSVGDVRTIPLSAMSATYVGESHSSQDVQLTIIDFDHDDLVTPINGKTKAAISVQLKNCLNTKGYMNSSNTNSGGWEESARRKWCNDIFYNAIPSILRNGIKQVIKKNYKVYNSNNITTTSDYCFLLSETEIFGEKKYSIDSTEGTQYEYYKTSSNRIKQVSGSNYSWWERSPYGRNSSNFCYVSSVGNADWIIASTTIGFAPCLCI